MIEPYDTPHIRHIIDQEVGEKIRNIKDRLDLIEKRLPLPMVPAFSSDRKDYILTKEELQNESYEHLIELIIDMGKEFEACMKGLCRRRYAL